MTTLRFAADVDDWARKVESRLVAVFRASVSDVISDMQTPVGAGGRLPVDTGFLRSSLQVGINTPPLPAIEKNPGKASAYSPSTIEAVIAGAGIGDTIRASYTAEYALAIEYGSGNRQPRRFVGLAVARWQEIVKANVQKLKGMQR